MSSKAASSSMRSVSFHNLLGKLNHLLAIAAKINGTVRTFTQVQGTNDSSIVSKCSMVEKGYYSDPFLKDFVLKKVQRAPLINR